MGELRDSLTNTQLAHYMAFVRMYPMGDEAMDARFAAVIAVLQAGLAVVQVKRGKIARIKELFKRDFWTKPHTTKGLVSKIMATFKGLGMETKGED